MVAIGADGDRTPLLGAIRAPTQIIHGSADPLVPAAAGSDLKAKIGTAEIDLIDGMGHDLPAAALAALRRRHRQRRRARLSRARSAVRGPRHATVAASRRLLSAIPRP